MEGYDPREKVSAQVALDALADVFTFSPSRPVNITRWGIIANVACTDTAVLKMDHRPTAGSDTGRTDGTGDNGSGGTVDLSVSGGLAQGKGAYVEMDEPFEVDPGEEVVFQVTDAFTAGDGYVFVHYQERPFVGDAKAVAGSPSNRIANMTKVA